MALSATNTMHVLVAQTVSLSAYCFVAVSAFPTTVRCNSRSIALPQCNPRDELRTRQYGWIGDLWEEIIEFSTLGPGERKLKGDRERALASEYSVSRDPRRDMALNEQGPYEGTDISVEAFNTATALMNAPEVANEFDGYALRDLLMERYGAPLDLSFSRTGGSAGSDPSVYCNIMPVAFGSRKCRHESELAYLMHLQGVTEILDMYGHLGLFVDFVRTSGKMPRVGSFVPYRLQLSQSQLNKILQ